MKYLDDLVADYPAFVSKKVANTKTDEGRDVVQLAISSDVGTNKKVIFFECDIHAREWISPATCIWIIDKLVTSYRTDAEITALIDKYDWKFIVITNPDGYDYTWSTVIPYCAILMHLLF